MSTMPRALKKFRTVCISFWLPQLFRMALWCTAIRAAVTGVHLVLGCPRGWSEVHKRLVYQSEAGSPSQYLSRLSRPLPAQGL